MVLFSVKIKYLLISKIKNMKISKKLLQTIAVAAAVTITTSSCGHENIFATAEKKIVQRKNHKPLDNCPACGLG
jgi:hypothetical protein